MLPRLVRGALAMLPAGRRPQARLESAMRSRRLFAWLPGLRNINTVIAADGALTLRRAREIVLANSLGTTLAMWEPQVAPLAGRYRVDVVTASDQLIGRLRFTVTP